MDGDGVSRLPHNKDDLMTGIETGVLIASLAISASTAAASAAMAMQQAKQQNMLAHHNAKLARQQQKTRQDQLTKKRDAAIKTTMRARDVTALKERRDLARAMGKVKVSQAQGGLSTGGGSGLKMLSSLQQTAGSNADMLSKNTSEQFKNINSQFEAGGIQSYQTFEQQLMNAHAMKQSTFLAGLGGGIQGLGTGIGMSTGIEGLRTSRTP